jgi:hypothetical protein
VARAPEDGTRRRAAHEQKAREQQRAADDRGAGLTDERRERAADRHSDEAARVLAEERHETEEADADPQAEGPDLEQVAPCE